MRTVLALSLAAAALVAPAVAAAQSGPVIALVGGRQDGAPQGEHDFTEGVIKIERLIKASPQFKAAGATVKLFPVGFPKNMAELGDASVVVLYNGIVSDKDGRRNPMQEPAVRDGLAALMAKGVGLVALHQAFTVPDKAGDTTFTDWLGAVRVGSDRTMQVAPVTVAAKAHPITRGVGAFDYLDEFYPNVTFGHTTRITPVLTARIQPQYVDGKAVFASRVEDKPLAWTSERANGGRAVGYSGLHYLAALDDPNVRKVVLNSILWAAKRDVPAAGAISAIPELQNGRFAVLPVDGKANLVKAEDVKPEPQPWGKLEWFASRTRGNSANMTIGHATIRPGQFNPPHWHPNCDEILHLLKGRIINRVNDQEFEMKAGDTAVIPEGAIHNARNIGTEDAVLAVSFNSADRIAIGEN